MSSPVTKLLLLTSSGGGGHLLAAKGKSEQLQKEHPEALIIQKDILKDFFGKFLGGYLAKCWNKAQKQGNIKRLDFFAKHQPWMDIILWTPVFLHMIHLLFRQDYIRIVDTQPLATHAIIKAIRLSNRWKKKSCFLEKILIELPTPYVTHFLTSIKKLNSKDLQFFKLITSEPLLQLNQTASSFWQEYFGLPESSISYQTFPLRSVFVHMQQNKIDTNKPLSLPIKIFFEHEKRLLEEAFENTIEIQEQVYTLSLEPTDIVITLLLGSQPTERSMLNYIQSFLQLAKDHVIDKTCYLFIFTGCNEHHETSLLEKIAHLSLEFEHKSLKIIALSFQEDAVIAPLYARSNLLITRSGGMTSMELLSIAQGQICIHTEADPSLIESGVCDINCLGMPKWEAGNALYLKKFKGAFFVTPQTISQIAPRYFKEAL